MSANLWTEADYLAQESVLEGRRDYVDGSIIPLLGGSLNHCQIVANFVQGLQDLREIARCHALMFSMLIRPLPKYYCYPDIVIFCGTPQLERHRDIDVLLNPTIVVEVLSPTTEARDRREKRLAYMQSETIQEILFVAQDEPYVEQLRRQPDDQWVLDTVTGLEGILTLVAVEATLSLRAVYDLVIEEDGGG